MGGIDPATDQVTAEYAVPSGSVAQQLVQGPDGNVWFNEANGSVGRLNPKLAGAPGFITEIALPAIAGSRLSRRPLPMRRAPSGSRSAAAIKRRRVGAGAARPV